jgi:hypothetical protein
VCILFLQVAFHLTWCKLNPSKCPEFIPFLNALPTLEDIHTPDYWSEEELSWLQSAAALEAIRAKQRYNAEAKAQFFASVHPRFEKEFPREQWTPEVLDWGLAMARTRSFNAEFKMPWYAFMYA